MQKYNQYTITLFVLFNLIFLGTTAQEFRTIEQNTFRRGEILEYKVYWDAWILPHIRAGAATLSITPENKQFNNRNTYHIVGVGESKGMLNMFYKVRDRYETYIDEDAIIPWYFERRTKEGSYERDDDVVFNHQENEVVSRYATKSIPSDVQDLISALYYARTLDLSEMEVGDVFDVKYFLDDSVYLSRVLFDGRDTIKTGLGKFSCLKFKPMVLVGPVFEDSYPLTIWITDDENLIPIFAQSKILVGAVKIELINFEGLSNPLTSLMDKGRKGKDLELQSYNQ